MVIKCPRCYKLSHKCPGCLEKNKKALGREDLAEKTKEEINKGNQKTLT